MKHILSDVMIVGGFVSLVAGVMMWSVPLGMIVCGLGLMGLGALAGMEQRKP
jgi:hypothetical protein